MDFEPHVRVHATRGRNLRIRWRHRGREGDISSGTKDRREAERRCLVLEEHLRCGKWPEEKHWATPWEDFKKRFEVQWLDDASTKYVKLWRTSVRHFERLIGPETIDEITADTIMRFQVELSSENLSPTSVASYVRHLMVGLNRAADYGMIEPIRIPQKKKRRGLGKRVSTMRSRPVTVDEFDLLLDAVVRTRPRSKAGPYVRRFLQGLRYSGLRLGELYQLRWEWDAPLHLRLGELPLITFLGGQKNGADLYLPAPPEFWQLVGEAKPSGFVFDLPGRGGRGRMQYESISKWICDVGKTAAVQTGAGKHASSHDIRRTFITDVAGRASMTQTQTIARHSDPRTTTQYYVLHEAKQLAENLGWAKCGPEAQTTR